MHHFDAQKAIKRARSRTNERHYATPIPPIPQCTEARAMMNVDSSGNMVVSPISVRGQERLARLRASIQHQFGGRAPPSRSIDMNAQQQPVRSKIRQRIHEAARMTSDEIFFREFGSPKQLVALDFDLARTEQPRLSSRHVDLRVGASASVNNSSVRAVTTTTQYSNAPQPSFSSTSARVEQSRLDQASAANRSHAMNALSHLSSRSSTHVPAAAASGRDMAMAASVSSQAHGRATDRPAAYVSQLQRPTRITTPKKQTLKRQRSADEPPSAEKAAVGLQPPPAQKPRLLNDVTSTFNNRSFSNVGQARGATTSSITSRSAVNTFLSSPVRKAPPLFARKTTTLMQLPSPSRSFRVPTSTTRLFGQRQSSYR